MEIESRLVYRGNFLLVQEYLAYLLQVRQKNPKSVERYRFWLNHLLLWAMEVPLHRATSISPPFSDYVRSKNFAQESQKKIVETARAFLRWAKLYHEKKFASLPAYWVEDLTPIRVQRKSVSKYVRLEEILKIGHKTPGKENLALWRDQAMACLLFYEWCSGWSSRDSANTSDPLKRSIPSYRAENGIRCTNQVIQVSNHLPASDSGTARFCTWLG